MDSFALYVEVRQLGIISFQFSNQNSCIVHCSASFQYPLYSLACWYYYCLNHSIARQPCHASVQ